MDQIILNIFCSIVANFVTNFLKKLIERSRASGRGNDISGSLRE